MRPIPPTHKKVIDSDPFFKKCARCIDGGCAGRITIEHALIYGGRQIAELWAYVPLCEYHHAVNKFQDGGDLQKEKNVWVALNRATDAELLAYSKAINYLRERERLNQKYGVFKFTG
jgi:hypothetical protein